MHPGDVAAQTRYILEKVEHALRDVRASMNDVIKTRIFLRDLGDTEAIARVHHDFFAGIRPANILVQGQSSEDGALLRSKSKR